MASDLKSNPLKLENQEHVNEVLVRCTALLSVLPDRLAGSKVYSDDLLQRMRVRHNNFAKTASLYFQGDDTRLIENISSMAKTYSQIMDDNDAQTGFAVGPFIQYETTFCLSVNIELSDSPAD